MTALVELANARRPQRRRRDIFVETGHQNDYQPRRGDIFRPPADAAPTELKSFGSTFYKYAAPLVLPKLRAATAESEKAVLQNAVTATDQQIDALVYELYGLTPEEIALVEGAK